MFYDDALEKLFVYTGTTGVDGIVGFQSVALS
jgi:hypothetical protein